MTKEVGTLEELNVKPGDMVEVIGGRQFLVKGVDVKGVYCFDKVAPYLANDLPFRIISRATQPAKLWRDMTDAEKGALLLAKHDGMVIEWHEGENVWEAGVPNWVDTCAYRVRPEPKIEVVAEDVELDGKIVVLEYTTINGVMDKSTIKARK